MEMTSENNPGSEGQGGDRPPVPGPVPWLMYRHGEEELNHQAFCTISSSSATTRLTFPIEQRTIPELHTSRVIRACCHGWLLLSRKDGDQLLFHLWNPVTSESVDLPRPVGLDLKSYYSCIFTSSPKEPGCTIFLFDDEGPNIAYCKPGGEWAKHECGTDVGNLFGEEYKSSPFQSQVACLDGVLYTFTYLKRHMVSIAVGDQNRLEVKSVNLKEPWTRQSWSRYRSYLLVSFGQLYSIQMNYHDTEHSPGVTGVEVYKLDFSRMEWEEVTSMKDRTFFLGRNCCTSCLAQSESDMIIRGNQIHFIDGDRFLYTYDMGHRTILSSLPGNGMRLAVSYWVTPDTLVVPSAGSKGELLTEPEKESSTSYDRHDENNLYSDIYLSIGRYLEKPQDYLHFLDAFQKLELASPPLKDEFPTPLLVTFWNDKLFFSFKDPKDNHTYILRSPEPFLGKFICSSKDGYLLLYNRESMLFLNPFTGEHGQIPESESSPTRATLSSSPASSDCLLVEISECGYDICVDFIRLNGDDRQWHEEWFKNATEFCPNGNSPVVYDGKLYVLSEEGVLGVFKMEGDKPSWEVLDDLEAPCDHFVYSYLVECGGELMAVFMGCFGRWVEVYKLDFTEMEWDEVTSLGNYMLFVSQCYSFSVIATSAGMENKIYIPRLYDNHIVYYSLETEKFHTRASDKGMDCFSGMEEQLHSTWIQPRGF